MSLPEPDQCQECVVCHKAASLRDKRFQGLVFCEKTCQVAFYNLVRDTDDKTESTGHIGDKFSDALGGALWPILLALDIPTLAALNMTFRSVQAMTAREDFRRSYIRAHMPEMRNQMHRLVARENYMHSWVPLMLEENVWSAAHELDKGLQTASLHGRTQMVAYLLADGRANPAADDNQAIISAAFAGNHEIVELLLKDPRVDPTAQGGKVLMNAVHHRHPLTVRILLKDGRIDPSVNDSEILRVAIYEHAGLEVIKLLLRDERVGHLTGALAVARHSQESEAERLIQLQIAQRKRERRIESNIGDDASPSLRNIKAHVMESTQCQECIMCRKVAHLRDKRFQGLVFCEKACQVAFYNLVRDADDKTELAENIGDKFSDALGSALWPILLALDIPTLAVLNITFRSVQAMTAREDFRRSYIRAHIPEMRHQMFLLSLRPDYLLSWVPLMLSENVLNTRELHDRFGMAAAHGRTQMIAYLLADERVDPAVHDNYAVVSAAGSGNYKTLELLLNDPRVDPTARGGQVLNRAVRQEHPFIIRMLLLDGRIDPGANFSEALRIAVRDNLDLEIVKILLSDDRVGHLELALQLALSETNFHAAYLIQDEIERRNVKRRRRRKAPERYIASYIGDDTSSSLTGTGDNMADSTQCQECVVCHKAASLRDKRFQGLVFCEKACRVTFYNLVRDSDKTESTGHIGDKFSDALGSALWPILLALDIPTLVALTKTYRSVETVTLREEFRRAYIRAHLDEMDELLHSLIRKPDVMLSWVPLMLEENVWGDDGHDDDDEDDGDYNYYTWGLLTAADHGRSQMVAYLLADKRVDPAAVDNLAVINAASSGDYKTLELLLNDPRVDPTAQYGKALVEAAAKGHVFIVRILLIDGRIQPNLADVLTRMQFTDKRSEIVRLLLRDERTTDLPRAARLARLHHYWDDARLIDDEIERREKLQKKPAKRLLETQIGNDASSPLTNTGDNDDDDDDDLIDYDDLFMDPRVGTHLLSTVNDEERKRDMHLLVQCISECFVNDVDIGDPYIGRRHGGGSSGRGKRVSRAKAREILHHKSVKGHPLTEKQRRYFGWIAGGSKPYK